MSWATVTRVILPKHSGAGRAFPQVSIEAGYEFCEQRFCGPEPDKGDLNGGAVSHAA